VHIELTDITIFHFFDKYLTFYKVNFLEVHCSNNPQIVQTMFEQYVDRLIGRLIVRTTPLVDTLYIYIQGVPKVQPDVLGYAYGYINGIIAIL
jgi:hypothetical protein